MKKLDFILVFAVLLISNYLYSQGINDLIPHNTATHTAVANGNWFDAATWSAGTVPSDAAIVVIPSGFTVIYEGNSTAQLFALRVDGTFKIQQTNSSQTSRIVLDTYIGTMNSLTQIQANSSSDGSIEIDFTPFDIEAHKAGSSGFSQVWNASALAHFSDGATTYEVTYDVGPDSRFSNYSDALNGDTSVTETSRSLIDDGAGVLGRHDWDPEQFTLGFVTMGQLEILGQEKLNMIKLASDASRFQNSIELTTEPTGWEVGDRIIVTRGGNQGATANGEDEVTIASISGTTITTTTNLQKNHEGRPSDDLHCYVGNLTRNITFKSTNTSTVHHRGHLMAMHNDTNVQIRDAAFVDMGRTDKSKLTDDFVWEQWVEPIVFRSFVSALGQECSQLKKNPVEDITNPRGRYSIHLHKTGAANGANMTFVEGNVVWGNPGWGITQHEAHASVSKNVVYDVVGAGIVTEAGNESGFWDDNLVVNIFRGHTTDPYHASLFYDDYLYNGEGLGMKGRAVVCRNNIIANANRGVGVMNLNPAINNMARMDATVLANRPGYEVDNFPLSVNGYSKEGDGVMPVEVALIMENTTVIWCVDGFRSIERDMGLNHESRSIFDGFKVWGANLGFRITYQADYTFNDVFISGKNMNSGGVFMWKHSHNHVFDRIKFVDLDYAVEASKLVEQSNGNFKTRNNGFTPWVFIDVETSNVSNFYKIRPELATTTEPYTEHGDNSIILSSSEIDTRPTTFTVLDSTQLRVDYNTADLQFSVDGVITDDLGSYDMGVKQAWAQGTLRVDYPERIYEFASTAKLDEYVAANGVFRDEDTNELYFIVEEALPNRLTNEYTTFPVRIVIENPPSSGDYAAATIENAIALLPKNQMLSRFATVSQSSTDNTLSFGGASIDGGPQKAVDGNNNGRINAQFYQQGLVPIGSISSTNIEFEPWYEMDLGEIKEINFIDIWNSVQLQGNDMETPTSYFQNFYVLVSDTPFSNGSLTDARNEADYEYAYVGGASRKFSLNDLGVQGRYVRMQASGTTKIEIAEFEVIGKTLDASNLSVSDEIFSDVLVYPNPTSKKVNIDLVKSYESIDVHISNILGQQILNRTFENRTNIPLELNGSNGLYFIKVIIDKKESKVFKIVKK